MTKQSASALRASQKYDLLTALGAWSLAQDKSLQRQVLRLIVLITARYNWQRDELILSQSEIARLWSVDVRTVKRDMAAFRARGWILEKRRGTPGQAAVLGLGLEQMLRDTQSAWETVGADLSQRLAPAEGPQVIPFRSAVTRAPAAAQTPGWQAVAAQLQAREPEVYQAWFAALEPVSEAGELVLRAPSAFHASYLQSHYLRRLQQLHGAPVRIIA